MTPAKADIVKLSPNALFQDLDGEAVLLNLDSERYFGLDDIGVRFWQLLETTGSLDEVVAQALLEFDVDEATLRRDLTVFLSELQQAGLVMASAE